MFGADFLVTSSKKHDCRLQSYANAHLLQAGLCCAFIAAPGKELAGLTTFATAQKPWKESVWDYEVRVVKSSRQSKQASCEIRLARELN